MDQSWKQFREGVKSRLSAIARSVWCGRERLRRKVQRLRLQVTQLLQKLRHAEARRQREIARLHALIAQRDERIRGLEHDLLVLKQQPIVLPPDPPLPRHRFGLRLMSLALRLVSVVGLRGSEKAISIFWDWLGVEEKLPHWTTIRTWLQRLGVAGLKAPIEPADDWVWFVDHSVQIGQEKVLVIVGMRASQLPEPGTPLRHSDVRLLYMKVGTSWSTEEVSACYEELIKTAGAPRLILSDGASALRDAALKLKLQHPHLELAGDFKHKAANVLKSIVGNDPRFQSFQADVGTTRAAIQQTELAHLVPPNKRPKARFMNLSGLLKWSELAGWVVADPNAVARQGIAESRVNDKLGWIKDYIPEIARWSECQTVVSLGVTLIAEEGLTSQAASNFAALVAPHQHDESSREVARLLTEFLQDSAQVLKPGERLPLSTEILESAFGLYKQLEGQHAKGGFTSLLAGFGALLLAPTPAVLKEAFGRVSVSDTTNWIEQELGTTVPAKRQAAYREFKSKRPRATKPTSTA